MLELEGRELESRLKSGGVAEWNAYRRTDLADVDLYFTFENFESSDIPHDLTGIDLSRCKIESGCCFVDGTNLTDANLRDSAFPGGFFIKAINFSGADLRNADFAGVQLDKCSFAKADLRGANFSFTQLARVGEVLDPETEEYVKRIRSADLSGAQIQGLNIMGCKIQTEIGYMPETATNVEEFARYAREAEMNLDGAVGDVCAEVEWEGHFNTYRRR